MRFLFAGLFAFGILTAWVPALWPVTVFQTGMFALAGAVLVRTLLKDRPLLPGRGAVIPLAVFAFATSWGVLQILLDLTVYAFATKVAILHWTTVLAAFFVASVLFGDAGGRRWLRSAMLWFGFALAAVATLQSFTSGGKVFWLFPTEFKDFLMGPIPSRNHYAAFVEVILPVAVWKAIRDRRNSLLYGLTTGVLFASVIASASRAGTVLCAAEVFLVSALLWRRESRGAAGRLLLRMSLLLLLFTAVVGWQKVWDRFWAPDPFAARREFAISTVRMIEDRPITGFGLGTWPTAYPRYAIVDVGAFANEAHSDWLQWTAEGGLPLGLAMLALFAWTLRPAFRSVWGLGVLAVLLHAAVDYPFSRPVLASWTAIMLALVAANEGRDTELG